MVVVEYKQPNQTQLPAVTVCAHSFISDDRLSDYFWEDWLNYTDSNSTEERYEFREMLRNKAMDYMTVTEIFDDNSITYDSLIASCYYYPSFKGKEKIPCTNITTVLESMHSGRKCFTLFNELNITEKKFPIKLIEYKMQSFIEIILVNQSQNYFKDHLPTETVIFAIHSANFIPTRLDATYYKTSKDVLKFDMRFQKQVSHLMLPPYTTNCRWYSDQNRAGERSRGDCIMHCVKRLTIESCFNFYSVVTRDLLTDINQKYCTENESFYQSYSSARVECFEQCQLTCYEEAVQLPFAKLGTVVVPQTSIVIKSSSMLYTYVYHVPAINSLDIIGNLGAHAHIWLGLSAIKLFHWLVHFIHYIRTFFNK